MESQVSPQNEKLLVSGDSNLANESCLVPATSQKHDSTKSHMMPQHINHEAHDCDEMKLQSRDSMLINKNEVLDDIVSKPTTLKQNGDNKEVGESVNSTSPVLSCHLKKEKEDDNRSYLSLQVMVKQEADDYSDKPTLSQDQLDAKTVDKHEETSPLQPDQIKKENPEDNPDNSNITLQDTNKHLCDTFTNGSFISELFNSDGDISSEIPSNSFSCSASFVMSNEINQENSEDLNSSIRDGVCNDVLVEFGCGRKKVFNVKNKNDLENDFKAYVKTDFVLSELLKVSLLVFQRYNHKFQTWVEIDQNESFCDGMILRAEFIPAIGNGENIANRQNTHDQQYSHIPNSYYNDHNCNWSYSDVGRPCREADNFGLSQKRHQKNVTTDCTIMQKRPKKYNTKWPKHRSGRDYNLPRNDISETREHNPQRNVSYQYQPERKQYLAELEGSSQEPELVVQLNLKDSLEPEYFGTTEDLREKQDIYEPDVEENCSNAEQEVEADSAVVNSYVQGNSFQLSSNNINLTEKSISWDLETWHKRHNIYLSRSAKHKRLMWARDFSHWTPEQWEKVIFSDVTPFVMKQNRMRRVCSEKYVEISDPQVTMIWGCLSINGPQLIVPITHLNSKSYSQILSSKVNPLLRETFPHGDAVFLYHCCISTIHKAKIVKDILRKNSVLAMDWPTCCLDVNPVEVLWDIVFSRLQAVRWTKKAKMISTIEHLWMGDDNLKIICNKLITSMPKIIAKIIENDGGVVNMRV